MRLFTSLLTFAFLSIFSQTNHSYTPENGFVPTEKIAITIAKAVLEPIYGTQSVQNEEPFKATLKEDVWTIRGTLPRGFRGGVAEVHINKKSGEILRVTHGR